MRSTPARPEPVPASDAPLAELSIVVVTWWSAEDVPALLASLAPVLAGGAELVVVENGSGDDTPARVAAAVPAARIIVNDRNRGFAAAANQGLAATTRPYVLFLNPDAVAGEDAVARTLAYLDAVPSIGILGCRTVNEDGSPQPTVDRFHTVGGLVADALASGRVWSVRPRGEAPGGIVDVDWLYGSFLLCRRAALAAVGGFDEAYEMYGEDLDLCRRVTDGGWRVVYFGDASIMHRGNRSGARRYGSRRESAVFAGTLRYFRRHHGRGGELAFRVVAGATFALKAALLALRGLAPAGADAAARARVYARLGLLCLTGDPAAASDPPLPPSTSPATEVPLPDRPSHDGDSVVRPALSIVILTWNSRALLGDCLAALPAAAAGLATEVIVVDNGSHDGTGEVLAADPSIVALRNAYNRGVAPARNQGLRIARGEFVALLDVDTRPAPGSFAALVAYLRKTPHVGLVGPRLVGSDGALQYSCRRFPTLVDKVLRRLPEHFGREIARDVEMRAWDHATAREVDYVIGACQVIRRTALAAVGLLDERIFYGPEDVDLCLRMHRAGWGVDYVPEAEVMHLERRVTRRLLSHLTARHVQGLAHYFWKHGYLLTRPDVRTGRRS